PYSAKRYKRYGGNLVLAKRAAGEEMGSTLSKEESAVVKLLQHMLSMRGLSYDSAVLEALLQWAKKRELIPTVDDPFELPTQEKIGKKLWDEISKGSPPCGS
ncbi:hypothetical protein, partial [Klebsiella pneumoniae]|uniref:hypothetical protein n=1 Tax=Klebsiella pneumoniae TaxID=573 RepID=UPI002108DA2B